VKPWVRPPELVAVPPLGAPLARLEGQIALSEMLRRAPDLELTQEPEQKPGFGLRGLTQLPVRLA
jgi:cytochrome P450